MKRHLLGLAMAVVAVQVGAQVTAADRNFPPDNSSYLSKDSGHAKESIEISWETIPLKRVINPGFSGLIEGTASIYDAMTADDGTVTVDHGTISLGFQIDYLDTVGDTDNFNLQLTTADAFLDSGARAIFKQKSSTLLQFKTRPKGDYVLTNHFSVEMQRSADGGLTWTPDANPWDFNLVPEPASLLGLGAGIALLLRRRKP